MLPRRVEVARGLQYGVDVRRSAGHGLLRSSTGVCNEARGRHSHHQLRLRSAKPRCGAGTVELQADRLIPQ